MHTATLKQPAKPASGGVTPASIAAGAVVAAGRARMELHPFRHWLFKDLIIPEACHEITRLPITPAPFAETYGKRDSHNETRRFFSPEMQERNPIAHATAGAFQSEPVVRAIETLCDTDFRGSYLRIEYCQDMDGFWLEPHMDIPEKLITIQLYLNTGADAADLGTDMYDKGKRPFSSAPSVLGDGMAFLPKEPASWHGFEKRPIAYVRRSLIINYVTDDWRSRHELCFPDTKIT